MTSNQTMVHHVRPQQLYSCDGTCTRRSLRRIPLSLVAFHICYLLDRASIHEMSSLMIIFHCIIGYIHPLWIFSSLYIVHGNDHPWHLYCMPIHGHYTLMYLGLLYVYLQSYAKIYHCILLMRGWFFHLGLHYSTSGMDIMYFDHHVTPLTSHIRGHLL